MTSLFRYNSVCSPYSYRANSHPSNTNLRVFKYFVVILIASVAINAPRFFETKLVTEEFATNVSGTMQLEEIITYDVTDLRRDPTYIR